MRRVFPLFFGATLAVTGCSGAPEPTHGVDTTLNDADEQLSAEPTPSPSSDPFEEPMDDLSNEDVHAFDEILVPQAVNVDYLVGTWGPQESDNPNASCDTDNIVTFNRDGTYRDGGGYGRYRINDDRVTYYNRVLVDMAEETEDRSEYNKPMTTTIRGAVKNSFEEDGSKLYRCNGG